MLLAYETINFENPQRPRRAVSADVISYYRAYCISLRPYINIYMYIVECVYTYLYVCVWVTNSISSTIWSIIVNEFH